MSPRKHGLIEALGWPRISLGLSCFLTLLVLSSGSLGSSGLRVEPPEVAREPAQFQFEVITTPAPGGTTTVGGLVDTSQAATYIEEAAQKAIVDAYVYVYKWYVLRLDVRDVYTIKLLSLEAKNVDLWVFVPIQSPGFPLGLKLIDYAASPLPLETVGPRVFEADVVRSEISGDAYDQRRLFIGVSLRDESSSLFGLSITRRGANGETLILDDHSSEHGIVQDNLVAMNRLTPFRYPAKLNTIQFSVLQVEGEPNPVGSDVRVIVFADPTGAGKPPPKSKLLFDKMVTIEHFGLNEVKLENGPVIGSGDFYIGYQVPPNSFGVGVNFDTDGPPRRRTFVSTDNLSTFTGPISVEDKAGTKFDANATFRGVISYQ